MYQNSTSWVDLTTEYKESYRSLEELKQRRKGTGSMEDMVDCELAGSMMGELAATIKELKSRSLYEFNSISVEDICNPAYGLTERQREILQLRQLNNYGYQEISYKLGIVISTVFECYAAAINKILKCKNMEQQVDVVHLSKQQYEIYVRFFIQGMKPKQIAADMGISIDTVKMGLHRIKQKKKTGNKIPENI